MEKENKTEFDERLIESFKEFIACLEEVNVLDDKMQSNFKARSLSLFADKPIEKEEFGYSYATNYKGSFAQLAQAHRHRTLEYGMSFLEDFLWAYCIFAVLNLIYLVFAGMTLKKHYHLNNKAWYYVAGVISISSRLSVLLWLSASKTEIRSTVSPQNSTLTGFSAWGGKISRIPPLIEN
jgi:hypothetical protein